MVNSDKKQFWKCLKSMDDSLKLKNIPDVSKENWLSHFQSLHSNDPLNAYQQNIVTELPDQENSNMQSLPLDYLITEIEIHSTVQKLKNNKSPFSDRIQNEMIKTSLNEMMGSFNGTIFSGNL